MPKRTLPTFIAISLKTILPNWLTAFLECIASLEQFPERGNIPKELEALGIQRYRQLPMRPCRLFYRIVGEDVLVTLIADGRRDMKSLLEQRLLSGRS